MSIFDPSHGITHDAPAHATELSELLGHDNALGDQGYFGAGFLTQHRKPFGGDLFNASGKKFNRTNEILYVIERS